MSDMQRQGSMPATENGSVPLACKPCRDRHVKCDGLQPVCSRCYDSKQYCLYIPSRRGRRPSRNKRQRSVDSSASGTNARRRSSTLTVPDAGVEMGQFAPRVQSPKVSTPTLHPTSAMQSSFPTTPRERSISRSPRPPPLQQVPQPSVVSPGPTSARLTELYYFYFHDSHPILIPQLFLPQLHSSMMPAPVEAAMYYIGSQYSSVARDDPSYLQRLQSTLFSTTAERNGFAVQAMVLLSIAQRAQDRSDLAYETLGQAMDLAIELGMNRAAFASENNEGSPVIEEMWRRVWWELYINDASLAASRQDEYFRMHDVDMDVALPCEEIEYRNCVPGIARPYKALQDMAFYDETLGFTSFTYRILAAQNVSLLLKLNQTSYTDEAERVASFDLVLNNWFLHLPDNKKIPLDAEGHVDQMMFQAHLLANFTYICLHRPRSSLMFTRIQDTRAWNPGRQPTPATAQQIVHTAKAIESADRISNLITLPGDSLKHSPLFAITVAESALVHLSAYVVSTETEHASVIRNRIALGVGALKGIRFTWQLACTVLATLRQASREVMAVRNGSLHQGGSMDSHLSNSSLTVPSTASLSVRDHSNAPQPASILGGSVLEYHPHSIGTDAWMTALSDPIFSQIPELTESILPVTLGPHGAATYA